MLVFTKNDYIEYIKDKKTSLIIMKLYKALINKSFNDAFKLTADTFGIYSLYTKENMLLNVETKNGIEKLDIFELLGWSVNEVDDLLYKFIDYLKLKNNLNDAKPISYVLFGTFILHYIKTYDMDRDYSKIYKMFELHARSANKFLEITSCCFSQLNEDDFRLKNRVLENEVLILSQLKNDKNINPDIKKELTENPHAHRASLMEYLDRIAMIRECTARTEYIINANKDIIKELETRNVARGLVMTNKSDLEQFIMVLPERYQEIMHYSSYIVFDSIVRYYNTSTERERKIIGTALKSIIERYAKTKGVVQKLYNELSRYSCCSGIFALFEGDLSPEGAAAWLLASLK